MRCHVLIVVYALVELAIPFLPGRAAISDRVRLDYTLDWPSQNEFSLSVTTDIPRGFAYAFVADDAGSDGKMTPKAMISGGMIPHDYPHATFDSTLLYRGKIDEQKRLPGRVWLDYTSCWQCKSIFDTFYLHMGVGGSATLGDYISDTKPLSGQVYIRLSDFLEKTSSPFPLKAKNLLFTIAAPIFGNTSVRNVYLMVALSSEDIRTAFGKYSGFKYAYQDVKWAPLPPIKS